MKDILADDLVRKAESKLQGFFTFFTGVNYEAAADLFKKAAAMFKSEGNWRRAGAAFKRAAQCCREVDFSYEACTHCFEAASAFRKAGDTADALACWEEALQMYIESNRFHQAGKVEAEIGDMYADSREYDDAVKHYRKSMFYYLTDEYGTNIAARIQKKVAMIFVEAGNLAEASTEFDKLAVCEQNRSLRSLSREYSFASLLCQLGLLRKDNLVEGVASIRERMAEFPSDNTISKSREYELVEAICTAIENGAPDDVREAIHQFSDVKQVDDWKVSILYGVVQMLETDDER
ncbi:hypothetical protein XU18_0698 [Perkinsela sp. CCAP 1560/4]|nr:hypothetical protein XU18_4504 [Perkinsela sp. CCAP 1560/4]KNH08928.1 hypothetical protein XU18_0698 [Perkinsela sp. CCAP 1560/4]|eukprot:KNH04294.1 hypothetical protein XU18_4504 [Perkinsela sp. CCAP 1560/4]